MRGNLSLDPLDHPKSLEALLAIPADQLHRCDIARVNLLCATGLPGAETIDLDAYLLKLDKWASHAEFETRRHRYRVKDRRFADHYGHSDAKFCAEMLAQALQEDCEVKYNPSRILNPDFTNSKDLFVHGLIDGSNGGTCCSLPVLYAAVGRRLRYPIRLVHAQAHLFCRWEGKENRFNIDVSGPGIGFHPDDYYKTWPRPIGRRDIESGEFLATLSPSEEVAGFLSARGWCLEDNNRWTEARTAYQAACRLHPASRIHRGFLEGIQHKILRSLGPPRFGVRMLQMPTPHHGMIPNFTGKR